MRLMSFERLHSTTACTAYTIEIDSLCAEILPSKKIVFLFFLTLQMENAEKNVGNSARNTEKA